MVLGAFWKSASGKLVDRWAELGSALVFWAGLLSIWLWSHGGWATVQEGSGRLDTESDLGLFAILLGGLLLAAAPAVVVARVTAPTLRLLEGYWPRWATGLWQQRVNAQQSRLAGDLTTFGTLEARKNAGAQPRGQVWTREDEDEHARLDWSIGHRPVDPNRLMPTRVGNVLRAAEDWPRDRYGLDSVIVWPRLWLVLPETTRQELAASRSSLDSSVTAVAWGVLFAVSAPVAALVGRPDSSLLPLLVGVAGGLGVAIAATVWWVPNRAIVFADLLDSAFDLYRFAVYEQTRWPLPTDSGSEAEVGHALTRYLWRGTPSTTFTHPDGRGGGR